jgi:hypothetical protein
MSSIRTIAKELAECRMKHRQSILDARRTKSLRIKAVCLLVAKLQRLNYIFLTIELARCIDETAAG